VLSNFTKLTLVGCDIPSHFDQPQNFYTITELILWSVWRANTEDPQLQLALFLNQYPSLRKLICWTKRRTQLWAKITKDDGKKVKETKSILNLITGLQPSSRLLLNKIALYDVSLVIPTALVLGLEFRNLTHLYTNACHWHPVIFEYFHLIFPKLRRVFFGYDKASTNHYNDDGDYGKIKKVALVSAISVQLMENLRKIERLEWIRVVKLDWKIPPVINREIRNLDIFFQDAGIVKIFPTNFLLKKNPTYNSQWSGTSYTATDVSTDDRPHWIDIQLMQSEMNRLDFKMFELDKIFRDFKTYQKYKQYCYNLTLQLNLNNLTII
jgi:hypothetical protein